MKYLYRFVKCSPYKYRKQESVDIKYCDLFFLFRENRTSISIENEPRFQELANK